MSQVVCLPMYSIEQVIDQVKDSERCNTNNTESGKYSQQAKERAR